MAVGDYQVHGSSDSLTFAESWNGKRWARSSSPNPSAGANGSDLNGVSCNSTSFCVAVGGYAKLSNSGDLGLIEAWNGRVWTMAETADPDAGTVLQGISCPTTSSCTAVGSETSGGPLGSTFAEKWSGGRWTAELLVNPEGATQSTLEDVSCGSSLACVAVGSYFTNSGQGGFPLPYAEVSTPAGWTLASTPL